MAARGKLLDLLRRARTAVALVLAIIGWASPLRAQSSLDPSPALDPSLDASPDALARGPVPRPAGRRVTSDRPLRVGITCPGAG